MHYNMSIIYLRVLSEQIAKRELNVFGKRQSVIRLTNATGITFHNLLKIYTLN